MERAEGIRTFVWLIVGATEGNEFDDFGMLHGLRYRPDDFATRRVFGNAEHVYAIFGHEPGPGNHGRERIAFINGAHAAHLRIPVGEREGAHCLLAARA